MTETILKCAECGLFCDASGVPVPITNAARSIALLQLEREGRTPPTTCVLCQQGEQRSAAALKAAQPTSPQWGEDTHWREDGFRQLPPGDRE